MTWFSSLFRHKKIKEELEKTKAELAMCADMLSQKQDVINQTNAYWKRKLYAVKNKKDNKKDL
jgi:hypothetical protein